LVCYPAVRYTIMTLKCLRLFSLCYAFQLITNKLVYRPFTRLRTARGAHIETHGLTSHPAGIERRSGAKIETHGLRPHRTSRHTYWHTYIHIYRHRASAASAHETCRQCNGLHLFVHWKACSAMMTIVFYLVTGIVCALCC
jgi:hypothetical protein